MLEKLIAKVEQYNPQADMALIIKAYSFGDAAHEGQFRNSGEKFFYTSFSCSHDIGRFEYGYSNYSSWTSS